MHAGIYRHYKGGLYQVIGVARHTETEELMVVYVSLTGAHLPGPRMNVRPLEGEAGWYTPAVVSYETDPMGHVVETREVPRFTYVGDEIPEAYRIPEERVGVGGSDGSPT